MQSLPAIPNLAGYCRLLMATLYRKQQVSLLIFNGKMTVVEIFKCNLKQIMYWENNKYSKERKEDLQSNDLYSRVD